MSESGPDGGGNKRDGHRPDDRDLKSIKDRLRHLDGKLDTAQGRIPREPESPEGRSAAMSFAFRIATELVAGVFLGGIIGWTLDKWLGTAPFLLIVFLLLGIAGGLLNSIRAAMRMQNTSNRP